MLQILAPQHRVHIWIMTGCLALWWATLWQAGRLGSSILGAHPSSHRFKAVVFQSLGSSATLIAGGILATVIVLKSLTLPPERLGRLRDVISYGTIAVFFVSAPWLAWMMYSTLSWTAINICPAVIGSVMGLFMLFPRPRNKPAVATTKRKAFSPRLGD